MKESWKEFEFLDNPAIVNSIFYPRPDFYSPADSDHRMQADILVEDDVNISCEFYFGGRGDPCILYFHGNGELASEYEDVGGIFNAAGINLFVADYRGYGRSGGRPTVSNMLKDSHALLKGFKRTMADNGFGGSHFIMGRSLGSASAIELAANYPDEFKGMIIESGFCDVTDLTARFGLLAGKPGSAATATPGLDRVRRISMAALIIHGEYDSIVPLEEGKKIFRNLGSYDKRMVIVPDADHNSIFVDATDMYMRELSDFIKQNQ
jgi:alpha-beta hydrolase superfamily lysophospholipase